MEKIGCTLLGSYRRGTNGKIFLGRGQVAIGSGSLERPARIMGLQEIEKKVWHLSTLGAALPQLVGYVVGDVARPSFVSVERDYLNGIVALSF